MAHLLSWLVERRRPHCKKYPALRKSGKEQEEERNEGGPFGITTITTEEWLCDQCGHQEWREQPIEY